MVRLEILGGTRKGTTHTAARLPIRVGRAPDADLTLEDPGVWPSHFAIERQGNDLLVHPQPDALLTLNDQPVRQPVPLRNGDLIGLGAVKIQFTLGPVRQRSSTLHEISAWAALAALCAVQVAVVYYLSQL